MSAPFWLMLGIFVGAALLRAPIALAMIAGGMAYLGASGQDMGLAAEQILNSLYGSFILIAVPMFIFAANVMNASTISERIFAFAHAMMGRLRGGLAHVNVLVSVIFSGMSGSAIADAVGPGLIEVKMMSKDGKYPVPFAIAVSAASATIGPIIPPSIPLLLYAMVSGASVGALFLGGIVPGLLMAGSMSAVIVWVARRRNYPKEAPTPWAAYPAIVGRSLLPMLMPVVLLTGIYSGAFTPTEAAAVAALYALILGVGIYRALDWKGLWHVLVESTRQTAVVGLIIAAAYLLNYALAAERIPALVGDWFAGLALSPLEFLLLVNVVFLVLGCLLDTTTMLLVLVPLLVPVAKALGVDLVHFGVVIVVNMMIGLITPPYGVLLFIFSGLTRTPLKAIVRELTPFIFALIVVLLLITLFPILVTGLPAAAGYVASPP
jgi:C4-dicarboxylate transporter, DctM subunit